MKTVKDIQTGHDVGMDYIASSATAILACNGQWLSETIPPGSRSLAQAHYTAGRLEEFASFFNET